MIKYTFFYVVGGDDKYYHQLYNSIKSLNRINEKYKIIILDLDKKLKSENNIEVYHLDKKLTKKEEYWKYKFFICQKIDTEFGIYLDCDTVVCYDRLNELSKEIGDKFGVVKHFYIQNFKNFKNIFNKEKAIEYVTKNNLTINDNFYCGGVFLFQKNENNLNILKEIFEKHDEYELSIDNGLYDETFLSTVIKKYDFINLNGSINHASCNHMPTIFLNNKIMGKNPFDEKYEEIFVLHGSSERQKFGQDFNGDLKNEITKMWNNL
jgi:hypothetical protein